MPRDLASTINDRYQNASGPLRERRFDFEQERAERTDALAAQREARAAAIAEKDLAIKATALQNETQQAYDTADFLKHFQAVKHTDSAYEDKIAQLAATYPLAGGDKNVQTILGVRNTARQTYIESAKQGGMYELPEGPARAAFQKVFQETGDIAAARAEGKTIAEGEKGIREAVSQGYLTAEDFAHPEGKDLPVVYNKNGSINYREAGLLAAQRAGKTTGKVQAAEDSDLKTAQSYVTSYLVNSAKMIEEDPGAKELYTHYTKKLLAHARKESGAPVPGAAPAAPAKPAVVKQNGVTYTLQPDGTYK